MVFGQNAQVTISLLYILYTIFMLATQMKLIYWYTLKITIKLC